MPLSKNLQEVLFNDYVAPLLKVGVVMHSRDTLLDLAGRAFIDKIKTEDVLSARYYQTICDAILTHKNTSIVSNDVFSLIIKNQEYNVPNKVNRILAKKTASENEEEDLLHAIEQYKVFFEVVLRDFLTPIYIYTYILENEPLANTAKEFFDTGTDKMIKRIEKSCSKEPKLKSFLDKINIDIRNSIAHERWRILDDKKIELQPLDHGATKQIILSEKEVEGYSYELDRLVWSVRAGFFTHLDNINFKITNAYYDQHTKKEIEVMSSNYDEKALIISDFLWTDKQLEFSISNKEQSKNPPGEIFSSNAAYEIVACIDMVSFADRCFRFLTHVIDFMGTKDIEVFKLNLTHNNKPLGTFLVKKEKIDEINSMIMTDEVKAHKLIDALCLEIGLDRSIKIEIRSETTVPYGFREEFIKTLVKKLGNDIIVL